MGRLTTHVLDVASGRPADGMHIVLHSAARSDLVVRMVTGADGRCEKPFLEGEDFRRGDYELSFHVAAYFAGHGVKLEDPPFLDVVVIRFGIADSQANYHVPLVVTPWSYSTYRGS